MKIINGVKCRTRTESLKHIIKQAEAGKIGPIENDSQRLCLYQYESGNNCAVGALFSKAQLKDLKAKCLGEMSIDYVSETIGKKNIEAVTGMSLKELQDLQSTHDEHIQNGGADLARKAVIDQAKHMLKHP